MNPRILEPILLILFLIATAFIAADMVNTFGKGNMQAIPSFKATERVKRSGSQGISLQSPTPEFEDTGIPAVPDSLPPIKLIGTITGAHPYAITIDTSNNKQEIYRLKESIGNGWLVHAIEKNRAILKKDNRTEILEVKFIEAEPGKSETGTALKSSSKSGSIRLDPREVEGALSDLNKVMTQARVVPNMVDGKTMGYRIFNIIPDSIYTKIGIMNSDIVERVNGVDIKSPDTLYQLFQQIKSESRITLDLTRAGKKESIKIEIR